MNNKNNKFQSNPSSIVFYQVLVLSVRSGSIPVRGCFCHWCTGWPTINTQLIIIGGGKTTAEIHIIRNHPLCMGWHGLHDLFSAPGFAHWNDTLINHCVFVPARQAHPCPAANGDDCSLIIPELLLFILLLGEGTTGTLYVRIPCLRMACYLENQHYLVSTDSGHRVLFCVYLNVNYILVRLVYAFTTGSLLSATSPPTCAVGILYDKIRI